MIRKKISTEKKLDYGNFKLKFCTLNKKYPDTVYLDGGTFISPTFLAKNYGDTVEMVEDNIQCRLKNILKHSKIYDKNTICILDSPSDRMRVGKRSYFSIQMHFKTKEITNFNILYQNSKKTIDKIVFTIEDELKNNGFLAYKNKND